MPSSVIILGNICATTSGIAIAAMNKMNPKAARRDGRTVILTRIEPNKVKRAPTTDGTRGTISCVSLRGIAALAGLSNW